MRKWVVGLVIVVMVIGVGTAALAADMNDGKLNFNFSEMLPFMKKMHPNFTDQQLEKMFNDCHGNSQTTIDG